MTKLDEKRSTICWFLSCVTNQLLHSFGGGSGGVVVGDEQHLFEVLVSGRVGVGRPGQVVALKNITYEEGVKHHGEARSGVEVHVGLPAAEGNCGGRPTFDKSPVRLCLEGEPSPGTAACRC